MNPAPTRNLQSSGCNKYLRWSRPEGFFAWRRMSLVATRILQALFMALFVCSAAAGSDDVPPSPNKAWYPPGLKEYETELAKGGFHKKPGAPEIEVDPDKVYDLPALIDIAERNNPK